MGRLARIVVAVGLPMTAAGCGSLQDDRLPPPAAPAPAPALRVAPAGEVVAGTGQPRPSRSAPVERDGVVVLRPRERRLELRAGDAAPAEAPAGVGPTNVACLRTGPCYVIDTRGDALLVYALHPRLALVRRVFLPGAPFALALDRRRHRLYVTLTARNQLVELPAHGRPHVLRRWPTVRQPDGVSVEERTGRVVVAGRADGVHELLRP
jgi:hypothetical protein